MASRFIVQSATKRSRSQYNVANATPTPGGGGNTVVVVGTGPNMLFATEIAFAEYDSTTRLSFVYNDVDNVVVASGTLRIKPVAEEQYFQMEIQTRNSTLAYPPGIAAANTSLGYSTSISALMLTYLDTLLPVKVELSVENDHFSINTTATEQNIDCAEVSIQIYAVFQRSP
jgi:hypothetical protein